MPKGDKYIALTSYLKRYGQDEISMTFSEIEKVLGFELSKSAYTYPAQWANSESQSFAYGWLDAGYLTRNVNIPAQTVEFIRCDSDKVRPTDVKNIHTKNSNIERKASLPVDDAIRCIRTYFKEIVKDVHGRYMSWQHCYNAFKENRNNVDEKTIDYLSLHLAFYLASWGMYRGSSFLLQKDYKVHIPIVKIILEERYTPLLGISAESLLEDSNIYLLEEISNRIRKAYADEMPSFEGGINNATDTLITKILLGTLGCVPAYDRYYVQAVREYNISSGLFNGESIKDVAKYYLKNKELFEIVRAELSLCGTEYPPMKLMDMCMWQVAYEQDKNES